MDSLHSAYLKGRVHSADPLALVCLLYETALRSVKAAREMLRAGDIAARSAAISKTSEVLGLLEMSLNLEQGGDISQNLLRLYSYMQSRLLDANLRQSDDALAEVQTLLATLQTAWIQLADSDTAAGQNFFGSTHTTLSPPGEPADA